MKKTFVHAALVVIFLAGLVYPVESAFAVPAAPGLHLLHQYDGTAFKARQWGDESFHGWETEDGCSVVFDDALKSWTYAVLGTDGGLKSSSKIVGKDAVPSAATKHKKLRPAAKYRSGKPVKRLTRELAAGEKSKSADGQTAAPRKVVPPTGSANVPVILINFSNTATTYTNANFNTLLFGTGNFSMKDFYQEASYGAFSVSAGPSGVAGWYTAANTHDYYGQNDADGVDRWPGTLVREAVAAADSAVNFAAYDRDGDCYVDVVNIVHQGSGEEAGGPAADIWSHRWDLTSAFNYGYSNGGEYTTNDQCIANTSVNVKVNDYVIQPETLLGGMQTVGVFAHEYGHALGLPDLYDTDYSSSGIGEWSIMAGGSWNYVTNPGDRPAHPDAWSKLFLGWVTPAVVSGTLANESINAASASADVYQLRSGTPMSGEYFLVENRQQTGFDAGLPGAGLLVWHIDGNLIAGAIGSNDVNNNECYPPSNCSTNHYGVALVQADNLWELEQYMGSGDANDPYHSPNNTAFTNTSSPSSKLYSGSQSGVSITGISASASTMTATMSVSSCAYSITPTTALYTSSGGTGNISVTAGAGCAWTAVSNDAWITITAGSSGTGNGTVDYSVAANTGASRTGTITAAGEIFTVMQYASGTLLYETFDSGALPAGWTVVNNVGSAGWTFDDPGGEGNLTGGTGSFAIADSDYAGPVAMDTELILPAIDLSGASAATLEFKTDFYRYSGAPEEIADVDVSNDGGGTWANVWRKTGASYRGPKTETVDITTLTAGHANVKIRFHYYNANWEWWWQVDDVNIYITTSCTYSISPTNANYTSTGGTGSVSVTTGAGCAWTATSNNSWITITSGASGTGNGTVSYSVEANTGTARTGTITIAGKTFTVNQDAAAGCTSSITPTSATYTASGGTGSVSVTIGAGCAWTATSNNSWITITSGASGTGSGTVNYSVSTNSSTSSRTGTISIAGLTFTVTQSGSIPDGDLDVSGDVTATDALKALRIAAGIITASTSDMEHGDVAPLVNARPQPDGAINIGDVVVILRKSVGLATW